MKRFIYSKFSLVLFSILLPLLPATVSAQTVACSNRVIREINFANTGTAAPRWDISSTNALASGFTINPNFTYTAAGTTLGTTDRKYAIVSNPSAIDNAYANITPASGTGGILVMDPLRNNQNDEYGVFTIGGLTPGQTYYIEIKVWNLFKVASPSSCCWNDLLRVDVVGNANNAHDGDSNHGWTNSTWSTNGGWDMNTNYPQGMLRPAPNGSCAIITGQKTLAAQTTGFTMTFQKGGSNESNSCVLGIEYIRIKGCEEEKIEVSGNSTTICAGDIYTLTARGIAPAGGTINWTKVSGAASSDIVGSTSGQTITIAAPENAGETVVYRATGAWNSKDVTLISRQCCNSFGESDVIFSQRFGTTGNVIAPNVVFSDDGGKRATTTGLSSYYSYQGATGNIGEGRFAVVKTAYDGGWWGAGRGAHQDVFDHTTGTKNGNSGFLLINANPSQGAGDYFYRIPLTGLCDNTIYEFSAWYASAAAVDAAKVNIAFQILDGSYNVLPGTTVSTGNLNDYNWHETKISFTTPAGAGGNTYYFQLINNCTSTNPSGNDVCIDDITVTKCTPKVELMYDNKTELEVCSGSPIEIKMSKTMPQLQAQVNANPVYIQWYRGTDPNAPLSAASWTMLTGETGLAYTATPNATPYYYRAKVSGDLGRSQNKQNPVPTDCGNDALTSVFKLTKTGDLNISVPAAPAPLCEGDALSLTGTTTNADKWGWVKDDPGAVVLGTGSKTLSIASTVPTDGGTYYFVVSNSDESCKVDKSVVVTVNATNTAGTASSTPTVCINEAITAITHATTGATGIGAATNLPAGVTASWAGNTITISGTPTANGTFNYTIPLTGGCGTVNAIGTITVTAPQTVGAASSTPTLCINTALTTDITHTTTVATGIGTATGLPAGVSAAWATNTITISGTPTESGVFNYSIPLTGGCGTVNAIGKITVNATNTVSTATPSSTCINTALTNITHATTGATGIGTATGLPTGVTASWAGNTITISGIPTVSGTFNYTIPLTGGCGTISATGTITVTVAQTVSPSSPQTLCANTALTNITHTTTGTTDIGTATGLPAGVTASFNTVTEIVTISGTPTESGVFNYSIPLIGGCGSLNATGKITVNQNTVGAASPQTLCINTPLTNITHATTGATGIGTATGLPTGVSAAWATNTITISGTPTESGVFNYSIPLTGGCGTFNATGTITVNAENTVSASSSPIVCVNTALNIAHSTTGATDIGTAIGLPAGVTAKWNANTITISGTPTETGTFNYTIPLTGGCGTVSATGTIMINATNTVSFASPVSMCVNDELVSITHSTTGATGIGAPANLPAGVSATWNTNTIIIGGTPTATGTFNYTVPLIGGCGAVSAVGTIRVNPTYHLSFSARVPMGSPYNGNGFNITAAQNENVGKYEYPLSFTTVAAGCDSVRTLYLTVYADPIPSEFFSPDGDGYNETWFIKNVNISDYEYIKIFDQFGKELKKWKAGEYPADGWDGTYLGKSLPSADYWYIIKTPEGTKTGHFSLKRRY